MTDLVLLVTALIWIPLIPLRLLLQIGIKFWRRHGDLSYLLLFIVWGGIDLLLVSHREALYDTRFASTPLVVIVGLFLFALFLLFGYWTANTLGWMTLSTRPQVAPGKVKSALVVEGPYRLMRHPIYFTEWGMLLGLAFITASWVPFLLLALTILIDPIVTWYEEKELVERFGGSYVDYQKKVPRLIPRLMKY